MYTLFSSRKASVGCAPDGHNMENFHHHLQEFLGDYIVLDNLKFETCRIKNYKNSTKSHKEVLYFVVVFCCAFNYLPYPFPNVSMS